MWYISLAFGANIKHLSHPQRRALSCKILFWNPLCLAQDLLSKSCANLCKFIEKILYQPDFVARHRLSPNAFLRNRILSFQIIVVFLLNFMRGSYQDELDQFFRNFKGYKIARRIVTKSALSKARKKLSYQAFVELNQHQTRFFDQEFSPRTWNGFRLAVFDGSTVRLPHTDEIADHFGVWNVRQGDPCPMARLSQMFDPLNKISLDAVIAPKAVGERDLAILHCQYLHKNHLVLLDRGYPAFWFFKLIISRNAQFCARISETKWTVVRKFSRSGKTEQIIEVPPPLSSLEKCRELGLNVEPLRCRLIRIELPSGQTEILITSLLNSELFPRDLFMELYHCRWPIEEDYKVMKVWLTLENFSGKSALSIYQDFHAKIFAKNLTSIMAYSVADEIEGQRTGCLHRYQINFAQALSKSKHSFVLFFQRSQRQTVRLIDSLLDIFTKTVEAIRPGRAYPRNLKPSPRKFFLNYKPIC